MAPDLECIQSAEEMINARIVFFSFGFGGRRKVAAVIHSLSMLGKIFFLP